MNDDGDSGPVDPYAQHETRTFLGRPAWMLDAACRGLPATLFHITRGQPAAEAKRVCATCDVRTECLQHAFDNNERIGIWGGTTEYERRKIRHDTRHLPLRPIPHGSNAGYMAHIRRSEPPCEPCIEAHARYQAGWKQHKRDAATTELAHLISAAVERMDALGYPQATT